jgi:hypothetical protein
MEFITDTVADIKQMKPRKVLLLTIMLVNLIIRDACYDCWFGVIDLEDIDDYHVVGVPCGGGIEWKHGAWVLQGGHIVPVVF